MHQNDVYCPWGLCRTTFPILLLVILTLAFAIHPRSAQSEEERKVPANTPATEREKPYDAEKRREFTIGVLYWSMKIPGQVSMRKGLEQAANSINQNAGKARIKLLPNVAGEGEKGYDRQVEQMYELVKKKVDLIIVQPSNIAALVKPLEAANRADIPVISYDAYIIGGYQTAYLASDNYQAGYLDGEYIASKFADENKIKLILVDYPMVSGPVERENGFLDALKEQDQAYEILKTYIAVDPESGARVGSQILKDFPEKGSIDVVFTINDGGGLFVVAALSQAKRTEIMVATIDGDPASVENIRSNGIIAIDSAQFCGALGAEALKTAYRVLTKENVPKHMLLPVFPITRETVHLFKGWLAPIPESFSKPWPSRSPIWENKIQVVEPDTK